MKHALRSTQHLAFAAAAGLLFSASAMAADSQFLIGGGAAAGARYSGASENALAPVIVLDYSDASGFFASSLRGLGYGSQQGPLSVSAALGYRGGRKEKDEHALFGIVGSDRLKGMGDIEGNASALLKVGYQLMPVLDLSLAADIPLSERDNGKNVHAGINGHLLQGDKDNFKLGVSAGFADSKYAQTYYGVTARQAASSRFTAYQADSGLYEVNAMLSWEHRIGQRWSVTSMLGANHLMKAAANSPLTQRKTSPTGAVYASYVY
jgi:outer membrane scaffolding protein for murein synthesis (MipA/OmpV family)